MEPSKFDKSVLVEASTEILSFKTSDKSLLSLVAFSTDRVFIAVFAEAICLMP